MSDSSLTETEIRTIARILRVNHAGEYGAIRIYRAQIALAQKLYPDIAVLLNEMLAHEIAHCSAFKDAMPSRFARACRLMWLWGLGGTILGFATALLGRRSIWSCTEAVEATVHRHLGDQLRFLQGRDDQLHAVIIAIQKEEVAHLHSAQQRVGDKAALHRIIGQVVRVSTEMVIWLATRGDSRRLGLELAKV